MQKLTAITGTALALTLASCGDRATENQTTPIVVPDSAEYQQQLESMPEGQRNATLLRAIRDAGQDCQHVESSQLQGDRQGFPIWRARCGDGVEWSVIIANDGMAQVMPAEAQEQFAPTTNPAPLPGQTDASGNEAEPAPGNQTQ
jgi:hypothetical protein